MIYEDIAGLLKTTAVVARTGLSTVNTTWVFSSYLIFVIAFGAFFAGLATAGYLLLDFFLRFLSTSWFDSNALGQWYNLVGYCCNFQFLWGCCTVYFYVITTFIALFLGLKFTAFMNQHGPILIQFFKNMIDWIFGEGL